MISLSGSRTKDENPSETGTDNLPIYRSDAVHPKKYFVTAKFNGVITPLGHLISSFPIHPRFGKMIAEALRHGHEVISYVIAVVAALTVQASTT